MAHLFGIARNTVSILVQDTCAAIVEKLLPLYIQFPSGDALKEVSDGFKEKWGIPQCVGLIDSSHIPVTPLAMNYTDYYNRKGGIPCWCRQSWIISANSETSLIRAVWEQGGYRIIVEFEFEFQFEFGVWSSEFEMAIT